MASSDKEFDRLNAIFTYPQSTFSSYSPIGYHGETVSGSSSGAVASVLTEEEEIHQNLSAIPAEEYDSRYEPPKLIVLDDTKKFIEQNQPKLPNKMLKLKSKLGKLISGSKGLCTFNVG